MMMTRTRARQVDRNKLTESMPTRPIPIRLSLEMLARLDEYVKREHQRGVNITRTDAVRILLGKALDMEEKAAGKIRGK